MNDPFVIQQAQVWADNVVQQAADSDRRQRIAAMVQSAHGVEPTEQQIEAFSDFLDRQAAAYGALDRRAWADLAQALWNMKAFYYLQ
jgi:cytolysin (calcineurin-like family phosphatase)